MGGIEVIHALRPYVLLGDEHQQLHARAFVKVWARGTVGRSDKKNISHHSLARACTTVSVLSLS